MFGSHVQPKLQRRRSQKRRTKKLNAFPSMKLSSIDGISQLHSKEDTCSNIFNQIDKDKNGNLDKDEFRDATKALNLSLSEAELNRIYVSISNHNGLITIKEFTKFVKKSVSVHKSVAKIRKAFRTTILHNIKHKDDDHIFDTPIYEVTFNTIKITHLQNIANKHRIYLPLLTDKYQKECFIGYYEIKTDKKQLQRINTPTISEPEDADDRLSFNLNQNKLITVLTKITPYSQIIKINDMNVENIGYSKIIKKLNNASLPHKIVLRKTMGIAVINKNQYKYNKKQKSLRFKSKTIRKSFYQLSGEDLNVSSDYNDSNDDINDDDDDRLSSTSIRESEKYVVYDQSLYLNNNNGPSRHCQFCPDKKRHKCLYVVHRTVEDESYSKLSYVIVTYIMILILVSTVTFIVETLPVIQENEDVVHVFLMIEWVISISFTVEYIARIICCNNRIKYFFNTMNLIDFLAVIPFWIELASGSAGAKFLRVIRVVRLARVIRLMKSDRFVEYLNVFMRTIKRSSESFGLLATLIALQVVLFGSLFYVIEADYTPKFSSIPMGAFYTVVTITTVGYGDMIPTTILGRVVAVICMFLGLLIVALPVIIIGGNFEKEYREYFQSKEMQKIKEKSNKLQNISDEKLLKLSQYDRGFHEVQTFLQKVNTKCERDIFDHGDVAVFMKNGLNSKDRLNELVLNDLGYAFYPEEMEKFKIFVLHELYGAHLRKNHQLNLLRKGEDNNVY